MPEVSLLFNDKFFKTLMLINVLEFVIMVKIFIFLLLELSSQVNIHVILWLLSSLSLHPTANNFLLASSTTTTTPSVTENREEIDSAHLLTSFSQSEHE